MYSATLVSVTASVIPVTPMSHKTSRLMPAAIANCISLRDFDLERWERSVSQLQTMQYSPLQQQYQPVLIDMVTHPFPNHSHIEQAKVVWVILYHRSFCLHVPELRPHSLKVFPQSINYPLSDHGLIHFRTIFTMFALSSSSHT